MYYIRMTWMNDFNLDLADCYSALLEMNIMGLLLFKNAFEELVLRDESHRLRPSQIESQWQIETQGKFSDTNYLIACEANFAQGLLNRYFHILHRILVIGNAINLSGLSGPSRHRLAKTLDLVPPAMVLNDCC